MKQVPVFEIGAHVFVADMDTEPTEGGYNSERVGPDYCWKCGAFKTEAKGRQTECRMLVTAPKVRKAGKK